MLSRRIRRIVYVRGGRVLVAAGDREAIAPESAPLQSEAGAGSARSRCR